MPELIPAEFTDDGSWLFEDGYGLYGFFGRINSSYSFQGRSVRELEENDPQAQQGTDGCWFPASLVPEFRYPTGGEWFLDASNRFTEPDGVGWKSSSPTDHPILYYRRERALRGLPMPCTATLYQKMVIFCNDGGHREYKDNVLTVTIDSTTITSSRDTNYQTITFPYQP